MALILRQALWLVLAVAAAYGLFLAASMLIVRPCSPEEDPFQVHAHLPIGYLLAGQCYAQACTGQLPACTSESDAVVNSKANLPAVVV